MRIGIDARLIEETGVGRYIRNLIIQLEKIDKKNSYVLFLRKEQFHSLQTRFEKRLADVPWHSITEQLVMPGIFQKARLDLLHVPYFNVPIFYPGQMIVTIHDLTILHFDTGKASTHPWVLYKLHRIGYRLILWIGLSLVRKIIAVSETTKKDIVQSLGIDPNKIIVTYEGVDLKKSTGKRLIPDDYFLYVGNAYPHKNLETLIQAFQMYLKDLVLQGEVLQGIALPRLVLVGTEDYFYRRLHLPDSVVFFGKASDQELANLYSNAKALVFPSLMEGFGLPAIEALSFGCPVICSDIPIFHEILGNQATFFDPNDANDLVKKLKTVSKKSAVIDKRFNWADLAKRTLEIYESCTRV